MAKLRMPLRFSFFFSKIEKNEHVLKTNGGSNILKRRGYNNKGLNLRAVRFPWTRDRIMSKSSQGSHERGLRR